MIARETSSQAQERIAPAKMFSKVARVALIAGLLLLLSGQSVFGDEAPIVTPEATIEPVDELVVEPTPLDVTALPTIAAEITTEPAVTAESIPTVEPTLEASPTDVVVEATPEATAALPPVLRYSPAQQPTCKTAGDLPEEIASGGYLDYECRFEVEVHTENASPGEIELSWIVSTSAQGWLVQLKPPATLTQPAPEWSDPAFEPGVLRFTTNVINSGETAVIDRIEALVFGLRVHRPVCAMEPSPVEIAANVVASLTGVEPQRIDPPPSIETYRLHPGLQSVPEPNIAFSGSLNFGDVAIDANGVLKQPAPQNISVTVSNLTASCGSWELHLRATSLGGDDGSTIGSDTLVLVSVDDIDVDSSTCSLPTNCLIAEIQAGPQVEDAVAYSLALTLELTGQLGATTFNSSLIASITRDSSP